LRAQAYFCFPLWFASEEFEVPFWYIYLALTLWSLHLHKLTQLNQNKNPLYFKILSRLSVTIPNHTSIFSRLRECCFTIPGDNKRRPNYKISSSILSFIIIILFYKSLKLRTTICMFSYKTIHNVNCQVLLYSTHFLHVKFQSLVKHVRKTIH
jgi:hypothetical protein